MATPAGQAVRQGYQPVPQDDTHTVQTLPRRSCCKKAALVAACTLGTVVCAVEYGYGIFKIVESTTPDYPYKGVSLALGIVFIVAGVASTCLGIWTCRKTRAMTN